MPVVPEIEVPTARPESAPAPTGPEPTSNSYFGKAVGGALSQAGEQLHSIGMTEYQRAAETKAQEAETAYQKQAQQIRDGYKQKLNYDAIGSHTEVSEALEKARTEIGRTLASKHGLSLYNNSTLKIARFAQEGIDSHFEQQNKSYQINTHTDAQSENIRMLAGMASGPGFKPESVAEAAQTIYDAEKKFSKSQGFSDSEADLRSKKKMAVAMDGYFDVLTNKNSGRSNEEVKSEFEKWKAAGYTDKHIEEKVMSSTYAQSARMAVRQIFDATPRLVNDPRFDGSPDPDGEPDLASIQAQVNEHIRAHPEQEEAALHEYNALKAQVSDAYTQRVKQGVDRVVAKTREDMNRAGPWNGVFHVDPTSRDYLWLLRNRSTALDPIIRGEYTTDQRLQKERHEVNEKAFKADLIRMSAEDPAAFEKLTPADLFKMQGDSKKYVGGFNAHFQLEGGDKVLKELKEQHQKGELPWIEKTTQQYLSKIFTNKDEVDKTKKGDLHDGVAVALQEALKSGAVKRDDWKSVNDFLQAETTKVGAEGHWYTLGYEVGGEYKAVRDARQRAAQPAPVAKPVQVIPSKPSTPHKILPIQRDGKMMKWDATDKKWVE